MDWLQIRPHWTHHIPLLSLLTTCHTEYTTLFLSLLATYHTVHTTSLLSTRYISHCTHHFTAGSLSLLVTLVYVIIILLLSFTMMHRTFGRPCSNVKEKLIKQIKDWSNDDCTSQQRCNYEFLGTDGNVIRGSHVTPTFKYLDNFNFTFTQSSVGCDVTVSDLLRWQYRGCQVVVVVTGR